MLEWWISHGSLGLRSTSDNIRTLALNVLAYAGFLDSYPFVSKAKTVKASKPFNYRESLSVVLENILVILVVPRLVFSVPFFPDKWKRIGRAITHLRTYMLDLIEAEKQLIQKGQPGTGTLVSDLTRASKENLDVATGAQTFKALSVDEVLGNIFVFNFAGHDTTAITATSSIFFLVANPEVQDWIAEEIHYVTSGTEDYEQFFPRLKRCLTVLVSTSCGAFMEISVLTII